MFGWLSGPKMPPMNPMQQKQYAACRRSGMGHEESLKAAGINPHDHIVKNPMPGEESYLAGFKKGGTDFSSPNRMDLNKSSTVTR